MLGNETHYESYTNMTVDPLAERDGRDQNSDGDFTPNGGGGMGPGSGGVPPRPRQPRNPPQVCEGSGYLEDPS